ncbi:hypothetical protein BJ166DRAFT_302060 [Pestalotiopsis sp. NC0098]|nr:hypothetical protein BJ166DRAFT_302060 [Pestalotiopsis sp. NC0098]
MSGAVRMEAPNGAAPLGGAHAGIFRPPTSPSISSSIYLGKSPYSDLPASASNVKRKRYEPRSSAAFESYEAMDVDSSGGGRSQSGRSSAGRDARYTFAGSVETPHGAEHNKQLGYMEDSTYSDVDYRRALGSMRTTEMPSCPKPSTTTSGPGWSMLALQTIGGVVGKVWDFCTVGAFRGFYAGGGRGYEMPSSSRGHTWCNEHDVPTLPELPGGFPASDYARTPEFTPPPAAKRRQVSGNLPNDELRKNWVMVEDPSEPRHQGHSPAQIQKTTQNRPVLHRRISKPVSRLGYSSLARETSRPDSRASVLTNRQPASFASPRLAVAPERPVATERPVTPSRLPVPSRPRSLSTASSPRLSQQPSRIPSPSPYTTRGHRRTQSTASAASAAPARARRRESSAQELVDQSSPRLDVRARNMVARRMQQEQETDERISDFNSRLMDMIRQGKEALGTTIEVDDYDDRMGTGNDPWEDD